MCNVFDLNVDDFFEDKEQPKIKMNKDEYFKKSQELLQNILSEYSKSFYSVYLDESQYPDESVCEDCKSGECVLNINGDDVDVRVDYEYGDCYYRDYDANNLFEFISSSDKFYNLICVDEIE